jgi:two-component system chemotaxis response regulator CheB
MATIRAAGGVTIAESESSCVVYGMPRAAVLRGGAEWVLPLSDIAELLAGMKPGGTQDSRLVTEASTQRR